MADWNKPDLSSYEVNVLDELKNRDLSLARMFKGTTDTNLPVDSIRLDWTGLVGRFGKWNGTTWDTLTLSQDNLPSATSSVKGIAKIATTAEITARTSTDTVVPPSGLSSARVESADKLTTAIKIGGVSFDGSANINLPGVNTAGNQNTSGNAATATKLATARTIGGVSFNGTANIDLPGVNIAGNQNTSGNAATATYAATAGSVAWSNVTSKALSWGEVQITEYVNSYDGPVNWQAPDGTVVVGEYSEHNNTAEDRRFKFRYRALGV